jgi:hypothetical protein
MKRFTMAFLVLAASGGCFTVDRDPYDYEAPRRTSSAQPWTPAAQSSWRNADGKPIQTSYPDSNARPSMPSMNSYTMSAGKNISNASTSTASAQSGSKNDEELVKATYTVAKSKPEGEKTSTTASSVTPAKKPTSSTPETAEAKSPPVNLGVLRLINSKRITFRYEVKDPASAGVAGLELWGTTDSRSWKKYDTVKSAPNSLVVDVKDEGLYGFTMVARGKDELTKNQPPQSGEAPQVWVAVDLTKPVVQLLGADLNITSRTPTVVIRWTAKDRNLGPRPVTVLYAERLEGPWTPIAANLENNGHYDWVMSNCVPSRVYVRVQATDLMGNTGMAQTTTLHIPGRTASSLRESPLAEPPHLSAVPSATVPEMLRPITATAPNPAVSILSVDSE